MLLPSSDLSQAVRLALQAVLPLGSTRTKRVLASGQPLLQAHSCIKGTFALVLRSMSSNQGQDRYTAHACSAEAQVRHACAMQGRCALARV